MNIKPIKNFITENKFLNKHINRVIDDDTFAAKALVSINVAKDVFAYARRFETTMKNDKIPDEKRPFVAAMDLMSGAVTAIVQIVIGFSVANPKVQNKLWKMLSEGCKIEDPVAAKKGFGQIIALIGSTIIAERVLVPLIATPIAEIFEKKVLKHDGTVSKENPEGILEKNLDISFNEFQNKIQG